MCHVNCNIADLLEPIGTLVNPKQLRNGGRSLRAQLPGGNMVGKRRVGLGVLQERAIKVYEEELIEHTATMLESLFQHINFKQLSAYCMSKA
jgi:hypothetical protein